MGRDLRPKETAFLENSSGEKNAISDDQIHFPWGFGYRPDRLFTPMLPAALPCSPDRCDLKNAMRRVPEQQQTAYHRTFMPLGALDHSNDSLLVKDGVVIDA